MRKPSAYLKMRVLGAIETAPGKTHRDRIKNVAAMVFTDENGFMRQFTWRTISTWYYRYKNYGITGVQAAQRNDKGKTRKLTPEELLEAINQVLPYFRKGGYNKREIYRKAIELGILSPQEIAQTTFYRFIREYELLKDDVGNNKKRLAFAMQYANQLWQGDTMFGPHLKNDKGIPTPTKLIALIDDASRVICHGEFFLNENTNALIAVLKSAFYKRGLPEQLYLDNGSIYKSAEIILICARVGCILTHTPVRDGAAKGKIERFFRRVRESFLVRKLDLSSLRALNLQFTDWVENEYNAQPHSAIGMKPLDRFGLDLKRIKFLNNCQAHDELFYYEETRAVNAVNVFSFRKTQYEAPADVRNRKIHIRYDRNGNNNKVIVFYKNQRLGEARPLDPHANAQIKRNLRRYEK